MIAGRLTLLSTQRLVSLNLRPLDIDSIDQSLSHSCNLRQNSHLVHFNMGSLSSAHTSIKLVRLASALVWAGLAL